MSMRFNKLIPSILDCLDDTDDGVPTGTETGGGTGELSKEDIIEFLVEPDDDDKEILPIDEGKKKEKEKKEDKEEIEEVEEEVEEPDELAELEEELNPPTEEQLELVTPVRRREILKKYPQLFKDFPYLEKAYYREQQYTEIVPTIEDAKTAVKKAQVLDNFESDIVTNGRTENLLRSVKDNNLNSFHKIVDEFLPTLGRVDGTAYTHLVANLTKHTIMAMVTEANKSNNDTLKAAAQILNQFAFGSSDFVPPTNLSQEQKPEEKKENIDLERRKQGFIQQQVESTVNDLNTRVNNTLRNTINANIDPKESMTDYVRKNASRDALDTLNELISKDTRFKAIADKLWEKAMSSNFSPDSVASIKSAYLSKAKTLLPSVIKKARNEALRGMGKRIVNGDDESTPKKGPVSTGKPHSQVNSGKIKSAKDIPKEMSSLDFLSQD